MKIAGKMQALVALALLGVGFSAVGCKSAPPLTKDEAQALIQAKYNSMPPAPLTIAVNDLGMQEGVTAKYWLGTKRYPNGYWADLQLTPEGKKAVKLSDGSDTIQWRPESPKDPMYAITVTSVAPVHLKATNLGDVQDLAGTKTVTFTEEAVLSDLPTPLQGIATNPGNDVSRMKTATFALSNGAWTLQSVQ